MFKNTLMLAHDGNMGAMTVPSSGSPRSLEPDPPYAGPVMSAHAEVATSTPDRFIRQLVSHLGRKAATGLQPDGTGLITIRDGQCTLTAGEELLVLEATADSDQGLARVQDVVGRHLERFGARAALRVQWTAGPRDA